MSRNPQPQLDEWQEECVPTLSPPQRTRARERARRPKPHCGAEYGGAPHTSCHSRCGRAPEIATAAPASRSLRSAHDAAKLAIRCTPGLAGTPSGEFGDDAFAFAFGRGVLGSDVGGVVDSLAHFFEDAQFLAGERAARLSDLRQVNEVLVGRRDECPIGGIDGCGEGFTVLAPHAELALECRHISVRPSARFDDALDGVLGEVQVAEDESRGDLRSEQPRLRLLPGLHCPCGDCAGYDSDQGGEKLGHGRESSSAWAKQACAYDSEREVCTVA